MATATRRPAATGGNRLPIGSDRTHDAAMPTPGGLARHPHRLLPAEPQVRAIAGRLYDAVRGLPILSPHGHVEARVIADDQPFPDPAALFVTPDHYVTRLLHASGVPLGDLGVRRGRLSEVESREVWRRLCTRWSVFSGTPVRYWLETALAETFDVTERLSTETADVIYDQIAGCLARDTFRPRALFERFGIEILATTDDPCDDLTGHAALAADEGFAGRVIPTFRPDRYLEAAHPRWTAAVVRLGEVSDMDTGSYRGWVAAMERRRTYFLRHGATSTDHSHTDIGTAPLSAPDAERIYRAALGGTATEAECVALRRHMLLEMARMSCDDGLVMMLHPAVRRNHHSPTLAAYGPDTGHDIPLRVEFTDALRPLLERFGTHPNLHLVLFTMDETAYSRELAPLAGFYPSVYLGAPWWFLDAPDAMLRFRAAVTETAGFSRTAGFVDDTRAFCSIPARHDMSRRLDCGFLARLVAEHRLDEDEAHEVAVSLVTRQPRTVFKL
jgi:glucuronate isomerase